MDLYKFLQKESKIFEVPHFEGDKETRTCSPSPFISAQTIPASQLATKNVEIKSLARTKFKIQKPEWNFRNSISEYENFIRNFDTLRESLLAMSVVCYQHNRENLQLFKKLRFDRTTFERTVICTVFKYNSACDITLRSLSNCRIGISVVHCVFILLN